MIARTFMILRAIADRINIFVAKRARTLSMEQRAFHGSGIS
jgi:hypothetical protein